MPLDEAGLARGRGTGRDRELRRRLPPRARRLREAVPYVVALVELPDCANANGEPVRIGGVLVDDEDAAAIGAPVEVVYDHAPEDAFVVPRWRISGEAAAGWHFEN